MQALHIHAGPKALAHIREHGLRPEHIGVIPGAAGGPKGLILGALDRFIFGEWLSQSSQPVDLVGASIGAWRMATACLHDPVAAFERLERDYIHQHYEPLPGQKRVSAQQVSDAFGQSLQAFYGGRIDQVLSTPRYRLHIVTSRGRHLLHREHRVATPLGYAGAYISNAVHRRALGGWLERVVFSAQGAALPFDAQDFRTRAVDLTEANFMPALQASCSIPFALKAVHNIPGAPRGAYWDGGITDYHLHLNYQGLVLYPHFQQAVVPGWLDKALKWRHKASAFLDNTIVLAPNPEWVKTLPNGKLPDRNDFMTYSTHFDARVKVWQSAVHASEQLAQEFAQWLRAPSLAKVLPL
ncbi:phospholipase [Limnohabitans sp. T6-5]|uniref:patatin-like phospholipase family protein n=1 Tax=Limnohabitans sp. T6-5 TaxID=1100724 RepID=UPI000D3BE6E7|nr:patatin-like phospholipase family protein [Limnohabitans sp. T6-5]PUE09573.1 phospholipase [Limnohabitans sp. T6-5]